ncbi:hypothetical protein C8F01DRAFT_1130894 [Mycena amicta]|nr:hypothetical protein C8F01DRAFT_1130894 [Mycena amicta]
MSTLPHELAQLILEDFDPLTDRQSLFSISLTCTFFCGAAQALLFHSLSLHGHHNLDSEGRCRSFSRALDLLHRSPHLASSYVRQLTVRLPRPNQRAHQTQLATLLPMFTSVNGLRLVIKGIGIRWDSMDLDLRGAFDSFFAHSLLRELRLLHIVDIPPFVALVALRFPVISFANICIDPEEVVEDSMLPTIGPSALQKLVIAGHHTGVVDLLSNAVAHARLQKLTINSSIRAGSLINNSSRTLVQLNLDCIPVVDSSGMVKLPYLPNLTRLQLMFPPEHYILPDWFHSNLSTLVPIVQLPKLNSLDLRFYLPVSGLGPQWIHKLYMHILNPDRNAPTPRPSRAFQDAFPHGFVVAWNLVFPPSIFEDSTRERIYGAFVHNVQLYFPQGGLEMTTCYSVEAELY